MADSKELLALLKTRYSEKLDLSLDRMERLMEGLDNPHDKLPRVIHVTGTNGKESIIAYIEAMLFASGKRVHKYISRHLVSYHERISLAGRTGSKHIDDKYLTGLLERVEEVNGDEPATFFETTTAAAILAFSENPADFLLVCSGQGGGVDPTNIIEHKDLTVIAPTSIDKAPALGETIAEIALEYSGVMRPGVDTIVAPQSPDASVVIENYAEQLGVPLHAAGKDWMSFEQHGRLVYQDDDILIDVPLPRLLGPQQITNAGIAIATVRKLKSCQVAEDAIETGLQTAFVPAQLQKITSEKLLDHLYEGSEIWLDSASLHDDALSLAQTMADFEERFTSPLHLICAMDSDRDATSFFAPFEGLVEFVATIAVPNNKKGFSAQQLAELAREVGLNAAPQAGLEEAIQTCRSVAGTPARVLICGSFKLSGHLLGKYNSK